jgi:hypothetical protein
MIRRIFLFSALVFVVSLLSAITSAQRKPDDKPITGDFKITLRTTVAGQSTQSTTMIKGARERNETSMNAGGYSMNTVNITQCDMRRTIQINDHARKYLITSMDSDSSSGGNETSTVGAPAGSGSRRGGVVNLIVNTVDTGERKEMFGFTARHLKRTTMMESSPDACQQQKMKIETDGWYINLEYGLSCPANRPPQTGRTSAPAGCRDRYVYKTAGPANLGYPLIETTTMYGADGSSATYTITKEVIDLSRQALDAALFDIPAGYAEAKSQQEMYAAPSMAEMMAMSRQQGQPNSGNESQMPTTGNANAVEKIRIGVVDFNNKTKTSVSTDSLRQQLIAALASNGIDAIALNASSPSEAVVEAQAKQCAYILYTDIATLKAPSTGKKIGGLLGRATGVGSGDSGKAEARLDFRLVPTGSSSPVAQSSASAKEDTQDATLNQAIQSEAQAVADAIPRT